MEQNILSRRAALRVASGAALVAGVSAAPTNPPAKRPRVTIGMATTRFDRHTNAQLAKELRREGIRTVQLFLTQTDSNYWQYNSRSDIADLTPERIKAIASAYRSEGIAIHSVGVYTNLIHPDPSERRANLAYFEAMMTVGEHMGVRTFITEAGHYRPEGAEPHIPYHWQEEVWQRMVVTGKKLARIADAHGATVLLEPYFQGFLASAKRTRLFLEELGSPHIRALLDPANLLEVNDLEEMFGQLGPWIDCFHAKDRKLHVRRGVGAGAGDLNYRKFLLLAAQHRPDVPIILEYVGADDFRNSLAHVRGAIRDAGLAEKGATSGLSQSNHY